jgi:DNA-binding MarR family transcriptional regulator
VSRRKANNAGRNTGIERYVSLSYWLLDSAAYRALSVAARALYVELKMLYNGGNNGKIFLSVRDAAKRIHASKSQAAKAYHELEAKGFIKARQRGDFNWKAKRATTWVLTEYEFAGALATKDFMHWGPRLGAPKSENNGPHNGQSGPPAGQNVHILDSPAACPPHLSTIRTD